MKLRLVGPSWSSSRGSETQTPWTSIDGWIDGLISLVKHSRSILPYSPQNRQRQGTFQSLPKGCLGWCCVRSKISALVCLGLMYLTWPFAGAPEPLLSRSTQRCSIQYISIYFDDADHLMFSVCVYICNIWYYNIISITVSFSFLLCVVCMYNMYTTCIFGAWSWRSQGQWYCILLCSLARDPTAGWKSGQQSESNGRVNPTRSAPGAT